MPEDYKGYVELSEALDTAICKGEVLSNRFQMRDMCAAKAVDISNVDICRAGGLTESKKMALIADLYGLMWTPPREHRVSGLHGVIDPSRGCHSQLPHHGKPKPECQPAWQYSFEGAARVSPWIR